MISVIRTDVLYAQTVQYRPSHNKHCCYCKLHHLSASSRRRLMMLSRKAGRTAAGRTCQRCGWGVCGRHNAVWLAEGRAGRADSRASLASDASVLKMQSSAMDYKRAQWPRARELFAPKQSRHSLACAECRDCSGSHADCVRAGGGYAESRDGATARF